MLHLRAYAILGAAYRVTGDHQAATKAYERAQQYTDQVSPLDQAELFCRIASLKREQEDFAGALQLIDDGLHLYRMHGDLVDRRLFGRLMLSRGLVSFESGDTGQAISDTSAALCHLHPDNDQLWYHWALHNLVVALADDQGRLDQIQEVLTRLKQARRSLSYRPQPFSRAKIAWLEGLVHNRFGLTRRGEALLEKARDGMIKLGLANEVAAISLDLARLYLREQRDRELSLLTEETVTLCQDLELPDSARQSLQLWLTSVAQKQVTDELLLRVRQVVGDGNRRMPR